MLTMMRPMTVRMRMRMVMMMVMWMTMVVLMAMWQPQSDHRGDARREEVEE